MVVPLAAGAQDRPGRDVGGDPSGTYCVTVHGRFAVVGRGTLENLEVHGDGTVTGTWSVRPRTSGSLDFYPLFDRPVSIDNGSYFDGLGVLVFSIGRGFHVLTVLYEGVTTEGEDFRIFRGGWWDPAGEDLLGKYGGLVEISTIRQGDPDRPCDLAE